MSGNGSGQHEKVFWGELMKSDLQRDIQNLRADIIGKVGWREAFLAFAIVIGATIGALGWILGQAKRESAIAAKEAVEPVRAEAVAAKLQALEAQKDVRAVSRQISIVTKQPMPARFSAPLSAVAVKVTDTGPVVVSDGGP